jgi:hypothetical protein
MQVFDGVGRIYAYAGKRMRNQDVFPLPITVDEVTAEWLTAALRTRAPDVTVLGA